MNSQFTEKSCNYCGTKNNLHKQFRVGKFVTRNICIECNSLCAGHKMSKEQKIKKIKRCKYCGSFDNLKQMKRNDKLITCNICNKCYFKIMSEKIKGRVSPMKGRKQSEYARKRISEVHTGRVKSPLERKRSSEVHKRMPPPSLETRRKMSVAKEGKPSGRKGIPIPNYIKEKIRNTLKEYYKVNENPFKNQTHTEETREKMRKKRALQKPVFTSRNEIILQEFLKQLNIEFIPHRYMREIKHRYQCDIFVPKYNLVIEADGNYWHSYPFGTELDWMRNIELQEAGFRVLRLWESEIRQIDSSEFMGIINIAKGGLYYGSRRFRT